MVVGMATACRFFKYKELTCVYAFFNFDEPITPDDAPIYAKMLRDAIYSYVIASNVDVRVVVLSGRGPIWFYCIALHRLMHVYQVVAVFDPKLRGAVVVSSHLAPVKEGEVIPITEVFRDE